ADGYPRYQPGEATASQLLTRGEVDAALVIGADPLPHLPREAQRYMNSISTIVLDDHETETFRAATGAIGTARFGVETSGDVYRSDGVALPLRAALAAKLPPAEDVLTRLLERLG